MIISESMKCEIVANIQQAKNRKKQVQIEADLHGISLSQVKEIMKEKGLSLRLLNGGNQKKKKAEQPKNWIPDNQLPDVVKKAIRKEDEAAQNWADASIPPYEPKPKQGISVGLGADNPGESWTSADREQEQPRVLQDYIEELPAVLIELNKKRQEILKKMEKADNLEAMILHHCIAIYDLAKEAEEL